MEDSVLAARIHAERAVAEGLIAFLESEGIAVSVVNDSECWLNVVDSAERRKCDTSTLYPGGWISCGVAREMAPRLAITNAEMGKILYHLDIKIRECGLGCF